MVKSIPNTANTPAQAKEEQKVPASFTVVDISQLQNGENPGMIISAKIVNQLDKQCEVPSCFLLVDYKHNFCVASIYHTNKKIFEKVRSGAHVFIYNPHLVLIQVNFKGYQYNY